MKPQSAWTLQDWLDYQQRLHPRNIELGLDRIRAVGERLGVLAPEATVVTVAGTNGKGSSVAMLEAIFVSAGYQLGTYTSPHLIRYNERIRINGVPVEDEALIEAFNAVEQARQGTLLTFFEYGTLAALWLFSRRFLDVIILEVGLGGRLDATNVVDADIALITAIDVDHADWLGNDREANGREKAGIMRAGRHAVISDPRPPASVIAHAQKIGARLAQSGVAFRYREEKAGWTFEGVRTLAQLPFPSLEGAFQLQNAAGVLAVLERLPPHFYLPRRFIDAGLVKVRHPGRMEWRQINGQRWLFDVAHNPQAARALAQSLQTEGHAFQAIFAALSDKNISSMIEPLRDFISHWHLIPLSDARKLSVESLASHLWNCGIEETALSLHPSVASAITACQKDARPVVVWGSFLTVGQVMEALEHG